MKTPILSVDALKLHTQLSVMLKMLDKLNRLVVSDWALCDLSWHRALYVEAAEYLEHLGTWKWWKKGTPDLNQANMELVDIWHLGLSWYLGRQSRFAPTYTEVAKKLVPMITQACETCPPVNEHDPNEQICATVDRLVAEAGQNNFSLETFVHLLAYSGMSFDSLYRHYVGKNTLNRFRQEQGYKTGTYVKIWGGQEDNEHLEELLKEMTPDSTLPDTVYAGLSRRYAELVKVSA